jgi:hypothetical protein
MTAFGSKRVRFHEDDDKLSSVLCEIPCRDDYDAQETEVLFFNKRDFSASRSIAKGHSRECEQSGASKPLQAAFATKSRSIQNQLNEWTTGEHHCRGLERWSNRDHGDKRGREQFAAVMTILQAQQDMLNMLNGIDHESLRKVAIKVTRPARHFARMMGRADSHALALENQSEDNGGLQAICASWDLPKMTREEDEISMTDSITESVTSDVTKLSGATSLLSIGSMYEADCGSDDDIDLDFLPKVDEVEETPKRSKKSKKLRLMKKIKRRISVGATPDKSSSSERSSTKKGSDTGQ